MSSFANHRSTSTHQTSSSSSSSARVDACSVQSQFASLTKSRNALRSELMRLESERRTVQGESASLKNRAQQISAAIQVLQESLGKHRRMKELMIQERTRLQALFDQERRELTDAVNSQMDDLTAAAKSSKERFCQELQQISLAMEDLLQKHEDRQWIAMLTCSVTAATTQPTDDGDQVESARTTLQVIHDFLSTIDEAENTAFLESHVVKDYTNALNKFEEYHELHQDMMTELHALRERAMKVEPETDFETMEINWKESDLDSIQLFYGSTDPSIVSDASLSQQ